MRWEELPKARCSLARSLAVIGDRWTLVILRDCFRGLSRFEQFQEQLGISRTIVTDRLATLVAEQVLEKVVYQERPLRHEYRLTQKGKDLYPVMMAIRQWGDVYCAGNAGPPNRFQHLDCGHTFDAVCTCSECGGEITADNVKMIPGPARPAKRPAEVTARRR